jgi:hypothetical protein
MQRNRGRPGKSAAQIAAGFQILGYSSLMVLAAVAMLGAPIWAILLGTPLRSEICSLSLQVMP